jgi:hypothetical protein
MNLKGIYAEWKKGLIPKLTFVYIYKFICMLYIYVSKYVTLWKWDDYRSGEQICDCQWLGIWSRRKVCEYKWMTWRGPLWNSIVYTAFVFIHIYISDKITQILSLCQLKISSADLIMEDITALGFWVKNICGLSVLSL